MRLRESIEALNAADTEQALARLMSDFVGKVRRSSEIPEECMPVEPVTAEDIRIQAAHLTRLQCTSRVESKDIDLYQQLMILFSLAVDRLSMLEGRGIIPSQRRDYRPSVVH